MVIFSVTFCSILNGRNFTSNHFTYICPNESSVVDTSSTPGDFLAGRIRDVNYCIKKLENDTTTQDSINYIYEPRHEISNNVRPSKPQISLRIRAI